MTRPTIPNWIRTARVPGYVNAFSPGYAPEAPNLYCTEDLLRGGYESEVLFLMKDACHSDVIRERVLKHGERDPWRPGGRRSYDTGGAKTNGNLLRLAPHLPGRVLVGSVLANLLRDDGSMTGSLPKPNAQELRDYVGRVLDWVTSPEVMANLRVVVCAGNDAWDYVRSLRSLATPSRPGMPHLVRGGGRHWFAKVQHPGCREKWDDVVQTYAALGPALQVAIASTDIPSA